MDDGPGANEHAQFPLWPTQAGMLFHALRGGGGGTDIEQLVVRLDEPLDDASFTEAWRIVAARHDALRLTFRWGGVEAPSQQVEGHVEPTIVRHDWTNRPEAEADGELAELLEADRRRGFDLTRPPWRVHVCRRGATRVDVVWSLHHLILDGRSFPRVLAEAFDAHDALQTGRAPPPAAAPKALAPVVRGVLDAPPPSDDAAHWRALLAGKQAPTPLPFAEPASNPLAVSGTGVSTIELDADTTAKLRALAHACGATMSTVVHALWALVLSRWTADGDVLFGTTRTTRRALGERDARDVVGMFIHTLPMRADVSDGRTVRELLVALRAQQLDLRGRERASLVDVAGTSEIPRTVSLFDTLVMFDEEEINRALRRRGAAWARREVTVYERPTSALVLTAFDGDRLKLRLLYERQRVRDASASRLVRHLDTLARRFAERADRPLGALECTPDDERRTVLVDWNATARAYPDGLRIHEGFEARADAQPDAIAVVQGDVALSYRELEERANRLAHLLRAHGAAPGKWVGLCLERTPALVVALLGIAKSGAAYVPIDPEYPADRIDFMLGDAGASLVVTERSTRACINTSSCIELDGEHQAALAAMPTSRPPPLGAATDACYAIFTSGSTGRPKGVVLTHRAVVNTCDWVSRTFDVGPGDRLLFVTSPCFDLSVYDTFGVLAAGATLDVASGADLKDPHRLVDKLVRGDITIWDSAPQALQRLAPLLPDRAHDSHVRLVMLSGDWIPLSLPPHLARVFPLVEVKSLGGATEAAIWSNWYPIGALDPRWTSVPYGRPIQNARYHVLDHAMRPVPPGVPGDLYIGGACLAEGYLNRPELTAERFVRDPFLDHEIDGRPARLYKTGDLARYFEDGSLEFLGRADFQVKVRGFRVELGEIESVLGQQAGVHDVVCVARRDASGEQSVWAYVTLERGGPLGPDAAPAELRRAVAARVPEFMVPAGVIMLDKMPMSSNGKLDRAALPAPTQVGRAKESRAARTPLERQLVELWVELLGRSPIGIDDHFFELGGHSLLAVALMAHLRHRLQIETPLSRILEFPTIATFAESLTAAHRAAAPSGDARSDSAVIELRAAGPDNLFLVFDGDGEVLLYRTLAHLLPRRFSVWGVPPRRMPGVPIADTTIEAMAHSAITALRSRQKTGPYFVGGLCAGGVIAYEMAAQLTRAGDRVALVAILDAADPTAPTKRFAELTKRWQRLKGVLPASEPGGLARARALARAAATAARKVNNVAGYEAANRLRGASARLRYHLLEALTQRELDWPEVIPAPSVRQVYVEAKARYAPGALPAGRVLVVKATAGSDGDEPASFQVDDPLLGWGRVVRADALEAVTIPGGHSSMLQPPNVEALAAELARHLLSRD